MVRTLQAAAHGGRGLAPLAGCLDDARDHEPPAAAARPLVELIEALDEDLALLPAAGVGADDGHGQHRRAGWNAPRTETRSGRGGAPTELRSPCPAARGRPAQPGR